MKRITKTILRAAALVAAVVLLLSFTSCGKTYSEEEIKTAAAELIEESYEINEIFFGEGLPGVEPEGEDIMQYLKIAEDSPYHTEEELKAAALKVYSEGYCALLFERAFSGFSLDENGEDGIDTTKLVDARFVTYNDELVILPLTDEDIMELERTYDVESIKVVKQKSGTVIISVQSFVDGENAGEVTLNMIMTENGWRLDSPTY
ncbi:MAG: hypothetical protein IKM46_06685 [Clostridia bacterium]|nr:hypothetical protein [Clostridia bacterium]